MRIGLIVAEAGKAGSLRAYAEAVSRGVESMGHRVDVLDARTEDGRKLAGFEYLIVLAESASFFGGKLPDSLPKLLAAASSLVGKKGAAFLRPSGLFSGKAMANLMRAMEKEGMCVNWSELVPKPSMAEASAKRIGA